MPFAKTLAAAAVATLALTGAASAQQAYKMDIGGSVTIKAETKNVVTVGVGQDVNAVTKIATLGGNVKIARNVDIEVKTANVITAGIGQRVNACTTIGTIDSDPCKGN